MTGDDDELDPSDWLSAQFAEQPEPPKPAVPQLPDPLAPDAAEPVAASTQPAYQPPHVTAPPPFTPPPIVAPPPAAFGLPAVTPPLLASPAATPPPVTQHPAAPAEATHSPATPPLVAPPAAGGGFQWGLTPGAEPPAAAPPPTAAPYSPPALDVAPAQPRVAPTAAQPAAPMFPVEPPSPWPAQTLPIPAEQPTALPSYGQPALPSAVGSLAVPPAYDPAVPPLYDPPATPSSYEQPTAAMPVVGLSAAGDAFPGQTVEPVAPDPARWLAAPLDPALDGVTEVLEAELVGLPGPQGEGLGASPLDDLFGDGQFHDFSDEPLLPRPAGGSGGRGRGEGAAKPPKGPGAPIPRNQKILMSIAGGLVAALALVALYALGTKLPALAPAAAVTPSPSPTVTAKPTVAPVGPVKPGDYHWDQLLGGECLKPFTSAWQDDYTVVECSAPHPAQLVFRGVFVEPASATYPGAAELQKRMTLLCTPATIINYASAGAVHDIQVLASYAVDEDDWDKGNHDYYCFVNRSGGGDLPASVAIQQVPVTPTPTAVPTVSSTPGATVGKGHAGGTKAP